MNISQLSKLGRVGGVPGIALGAGALVLVAVLGLTNVVQEAWRGPLLLVVVLGAIGFCILALRGGSQNAETKGDRSGALNESSRGARQRATTRGKDAPAVNKQ